MIFFFVVYPGNHIELEKSFLFVLNCLPSKVESSADQQLLDVAHALLVRRDAAHRDHANTGNIRENEKHKISLSSLQI